MKKVFKKISLSLMIFGIGVCVTLLYANNKYKVYEEETKQIKKHVDTISMMLETEAGSGNYEMTTASSWPTDGYVFNATLSKCENGGELSWDDTNKRVLMSGNVSDKCYVYFDKYSLSVVKSFSYTATKTSLTITAFALKGSSEISKYYFSIDNGSSYKESTTYKYTFSGLLAGTTYTVKIKVKDTLNKESAVYSGIAKTSSITIADICTSGTNLVSCVKTFADQGTDISSIYIHNSSLTNGAGDNSYRYAGASESVNNFVCFGSTASPCPTDNLYRIIGVIADIAKLIKYDYATSALLGIDGDYYGSENPLSLYYKGSLTTLNIYYWNNATQKNTWSESLLNKTNLNKNFITNIGTEWSNKIATTTWKVGGNKFEYISDLIPTKVYQYEIVNPDATRTTDDATEYSAKIGLMYVSDYGFAADPSAWTTKMLSYENSTVRDANWMHMGLYEWTISRLLDYGTSRTFYVYGAGGVKGTEVDGYVAVRPVFNLLSSVTYVSGSGTQSDPIRIN